MNELWDSLNNVLSDPRVIVAVHAVWLVAAAGLTLKYSWRGSKATWRGAKATGRFAHRLLVTPPKPPEPLPPPSPLAAAILQELDGETISDGVSVLAGGAQVWPEHTVSEGRVFISNECVDKRLSDLDITRITTRAAEVVTAERKRRDDKETAGLVAKVRPGSQDNDKPMFVLGAGLIPNLAKKRA